MVMMKKTWIVIAVIAVAGVGVYLALRFGRAGTVSGGATGSLIKVVAAEDFYGNIAQQLGGDKVSVVSILSDPNVDPHEYESNVQDGIAITNADIIVENGLQYDTWIEKLIGASPSIKRIVITAHFYWNNRPHHAILMCPIGEWLVECFSIWNQYFHVIP